jgi:hypothetical protein
MLFQLILLFSGPKVLDLINIVPILLNSIHYMLHLTKHTYTEIISFPDAELYAGFMLLTDTSDCLRCYQFQAP